MIYEPTLNNGLKLLCYQIAICCLHTSVLWGIQRLPPTLIMNLEFVLQGSLTMALKGQANPDGFGKNLHGDQSLLLSGSLAGLEQMGVLLLCTHRQMMPLCQWIADMHLGR